MEMRGCILLLAVSCLFFLYGCKTDNLTSGDNKPTISSMSPSQVNQGDQKVTGHISGTNFSGIVAVDLDAGIAIHDTKIISSTELEVSFSVNADAPTGNRTVRVTTLRGAAINGDIFSISNNKWPFAVFDVDPQKGMRDTLFHFDASNSNDPDGQIMTYSWDFGDNQTATGKQVTHKFNGSGNFDVKLTVTDDRQGTSTAEKQVVVDNLQAPIARYSFSPHWGPITTVFQFDGSGSVDQDGQIVSYEWDFKDGDIVKGKIVKHKFSRVGIFLVKLTVTDNSGLQSYVEKELEVRGHNPVAAFVADNTVGDTGTTFHFDASSSKDEDGPIASYDWKFGDGATGTGQTSSHQYSANGNYTVSLTVTDGSGMTDSTSMTISVGSSSGGGGACTVLASDRGFIYGTVVGVNGFNAIVQLPAGSTCANSFYKCGDMRLAGATGAKEFFGIIQAMTDLGNSKFSIYNACPLNWPPQIGATVFLYYKQCSVNYCP
jgi:PKD repeat protein